jgi:predicted NAD/FAD-dependent oxidoreductase
MQIWKSATIALAVKTAFALKPKVAVCGAGISGSFAAYTLDHSGLFDVSVYEVGRGAGGRTSTRRQDEYVFDHGAQSIRGVHTTEFKDILTHWEIDKVIEVRLD